jgi:hypothetical protein
MPEVTLRARNASIAEVIQACAEKRITFDEACRRIAAMGYRTTSVYEMVRAAEAELHSTKVSDDLAVARAKRSIDKDIKDATAALQTLNAASTIAAYKMIIRALQRARAALDCNVSN